jgi:AcrR family transcriptional regulator
MSPTRQPRQKAIEAGASDRGRSNTRRDLVESQIMQEATRLFAERGFSGTSLKDIADATGLTRPALYHYVKNKDELLARLVTELAEGPARALRAIRRESELSAAQQVRKMAYAIALQQATEPTRFQLLIRSEADLPDDLVGPYNKSRRDVLNEFVGVIDAGIQSGHFRPVDSRVAALAIIGQCNWVAWWHHPGTPEENARVAATIADLAVASLASTDDADHGVDPRKRALERLRHDVEYLAQVLESDSES